jgi:hypothetical protein
MSLPAKRRVGDGRAARTPGDAPTGRVVSRGPRPASPLISRPEVASEHQPTRADSAALRGQLLRFALTLPDVALGDSRLDDQAAGIFVRVSRRDEVGFEMREFATMRRHPRWSLSVVLPIATMVDFQRLGWGRAREPDGPGPLLLELVRPRSEADVDPLQGVLATAHRAAADPRAGLQGRNR